MLFSIFITLTIQICINWCNFNSLIVYRNNLLIMHIHLAITCALMPSSGELYNYTR